MTDIVIFRRKGLGLGSARGLKQWGAQNDVNFIISTHDDVPDTADMVVRWGNRQSLSEKGIPSDAPVLNAGEMIGAVNNKKNFAIRVGDSIIGQLPVATDLETLRLLEDNLDHGQWVVRPRHHAQGRNFHLTEVTGVRDVIPRNFGTDWYARPFINKAREYRVYVVCGRVVNVAEKIPVDRDAPAWNSNTRGASAGAEFVNVRWDNWPENVVQLACEVAHLAGIHYTGVDIMTEQGTDNAYFIEANSAPSLPLKTDGTMTYRHECVGKALKWTAENGRDMMLPVGGGWRGYVHPAINHNAIVGSE